MKYSTVVWIVVIVVVVLGGWWWSSSGGRQPATVTNPIASNTVALGTQSTSSIGAYLAADNGMTLYTYDNDSAGTTTCYGECAVTWPPYTVAPNTQVTAPAGAGGKASTITRVDGGQQATYNGMPLYFYAKDAAAGDVTGEGVGGVWHVVKL